MNLIGRFLQMGLVFVVVPFLGCLDVPLGDGGPSDGVQYSPKANEPARSALTGSVTTSGEVLSVKLGQITNDWKDRNGEPLPMYVDGEPLERGRAFETLGLELPIDVVGEGGEFMLTELPDSAEVLWRTDSPEPCLSEECSAGIRWRTYRFRGGGKAEMRINVTSLELSPDGSGVIDIDLELLAFPINDDLYCCSSTRVSIRREFDVNGVVKRPSREFSLPGSHACEFSSLDGALSVQECPSDY